MSERDLDLDLFASASRAATVLRDDNIRLGQRVHQLETDLAVAESEVASLRIRLEAQTVERNYYQSFAVEIVASLNLVGQVCDDVMSKAQHKAFAKPPIAGPSAAQVQSIKIPKFLQQRRDEPEQETG